MEDMNFEFSKMVRGIRSTRLGGWLLRKPNKTEFEVRAAKAYKRVIRLTILSLIVLLIIFIVSFINAFVLHSQPYSAKRVGTVEGSRVRYVQNTLKYSSLKELGVDASSVKQGDKIVLYFDVQDNLTGAESEAQSNERMSILMYSIGAATLTFIVFVIAIRYTICRPWYEFLKVIRNGDYFSSY